MPLRSLTVTQDVLRLMMLAVGNWDRLSRIEKLALYFVADVGDFPAHEWEEQVVRYCRYHIKYNVRDMYLDDHYRRMHRRMRKDSLHRRPDPLPLP